MRSARHVWVGLVLTLALVAAGCGDDDGTLEQSPDTTVATPTFPAGTTMAALQAKGKIKVGTKFDQPGLGQKNPTTGEVEGFDVEIAKLMAVGIFGGNRETVKSKVEFIEAVSKNREPFIQTGTVDIVVATYTINDERKKAVDFAGPYFIAHQDIMVKSDNNTIKSFNDLNGKKVCTGQQSTSEKNLRAKAPQADLTLFANYSACAEALSDNRVVAVSTDAPILGGLVQQSNGAFKLLKAPFTDEPYGIGLKKGDDTFRAFLNDELERIGRDGRWAKAFEDTLGKLGLDTPEPPRIDRYVTAGAGATTTAHTGGGTTGTGGTGGTTGTTTATPPESTTSTAGNSPPTTL